MRRGDLRQISVYGYAEEFVVVLQPEKLSRGRESVFERKPRKLRMYRSNDDAQSPPFNDRAGLCFLSEHITLSYRGTLYTFSIAVRPNSVATWPVFPALDLGRSGMDRGATMSLIRQGGCCWKQEFPNISRCNRTLMRARKSSHAMSDKFIGEPAASRPSISEIYSFVACVY